MKPHNKRWDDDMDGQLARIVLDHIREGRSLLQAYVFASGEVGKKYDACGYRWTNILSRKFVNEIAEAKEFQSSTSKKVSIRKKAVINGENEVRYTQRKPYPTPPTRQVPDMNSLFDQVIEVVSNFKSEDQKLREEVEVLKEKLRNRESDNSWDKQRIKELEIVEKDYNDIIRVLNNARAFSMGEVVEEKGKKFKIDSTGNLERVE